VEDASLEGNVVTKVIDTVEHPAEGGSGVGINIDANAVPSGNTLRHALFLRCDLVKVEGREAVVLALCLPNCLVASRQGGVPCKGCPKNLARCHLYTHQKDIGRSDLEPSAALSRMWVWSSDPGWPDPGAASSRYQKGWRTGRCRQQRSSDCRCSLFCSRFGCGWCWPYRRCSLGWRMS
jgi:hypothetical protein